MDTLSLDDIRCKCGKLLFKGIFFDGAAEIKCKRCGEISKIGNINLVDDATHQLLIANQQGKIVNASKAACLVLGYTYDELMEKNFIDICPTFSRGVANKFFLPKFVFNEDNYFQLDIFCLGKNRQKIPVVALFRLYQSSEKEKMFLVSIEPVNTEAKNFFIKYQKNDFSKFASDFYFVIDANGIFEYICPCATKYLGYSPEKYIGKNYFENLSPKVGKKVKDLFDYFSVFSKSFRVKIKDELYFSPNYDSSGKLIGYRVSGWKKSKK